MKDSRRVWATLGAVALCVVAACDDSGAPTEPGASTARTAAAIKASASATAKPGPTAGAAVGSAAASASVSPEVQAKCAPFDPPWGSRNWIEWGQKNLAQAETFLTDVEKNMKAADLSALPLCTHLRYLFLGHSSLKDLGLLASLTWVERLDLRYTPGIVDLAPLRSLQRLESLVITGTGVKDLGPLADLPKLAELEARKLELTDVSPVERMRSLRSIDLLQVPITDLTPLAKAPMLEQVLVCTTKVTDISPLFPVAERITALDICGTPFRDFPALAKFKNLKKLRLTGMPIKDLGPLAGMAALQEVDLGKTELASLKALHGCKALRRVDLIGAKVPPKEIADLKRALPDATVMDKAD